MKALKTGLLIVSSVFCLMAKSQTADEIINKHVDAIGGKEKVNNIKSIQIESLMSVMGNDAPSTTTILNGKGFKNEVDFNGQKIIQVVTDKGGWMINPMMGASDPQPMTADMLKGASSQIWIAGPLVDYAAKGNTVELKGTEKVGNVDAYKLLVTTPDKSTSTYYIDPTNYYVLKVVRTVNMGGTEGETSVVFSDFRKTDYGFVVPYAMETTLPQGFTMTSAVKKVEINKDVDEKIFDMPK
ncbi:MAG: hypothetical protein ACJ748_03740 [Flavisolibacter sp.]